MDKNQCIVTLKRVNSHGVLETFEVECGSVELVETVVHDPPLESLYQFRFEQEEEHE